MCAPDQKSAMVDELFADFVGRLQAQAPESVSRTAQIIPFPNPYKPLVQMTREELQDEMRGILKTMRAERRVSESAQVSLASSEGERP